MAQLVSELRPRTLFDIQCGRGAEKYHPAHLKIRGENR
jgi:hypothetical protein